MAYPKPKGYKYAGLSNGAQGYKVYNGSLNSAQNFSPGLGRSLPYSFSAAPADGSKILLPYGKTFTFTWNGTPASGVIPLVAGGGTAAQAATAAALAIGAQVPGWTVTNPSSAVLVLVSPGGTAPVIILVGVTNMTLGGNAATVPRNALPARFGKNYALLSGS